MCECFFFFLIYTVSVHTIHRIPNTFKVSVWVACIATKVHIIWIMELLHLILRLEPAEFSVTGVIRWLGALIMCLWKSVCNAVFSLFLIWASEHKWPYPCLYTINKFQILSSVDRIWNAAFYLAHKSLLVTAYLCILGLVISLLVFMLTLLDYRSATLGYLNSLLSVMGFWWPSTLRWKAGIKEQLWQR